MVQLHWHLPSLPPHPRLPPRHLRPRRPLYRYRHRPKARTMTFSI